MFSTAGELANFGGSTCPCSSPCVLPLRYTRQSRLSFSPTPSRLFCQSVLPVHPACLFCLSTSRNTSRVQNRRVQRFFATFFKMVRHFPKITTFFKMARHFSENLVTTFFTMTVKHVFSEKYGRDMFGLSSMYRRYHVHFQLIFEPLYFEPLKCSIIDLCLCLHIDAAP